VNSNHWKPAIRADGTNGHGLSPVAGFGLSTLIEPDNAVSLATCQIHQMGFEE
jgi:hypothetical protein